MREAHNNMRVNPVHAAWLVLESQATPMHMGALLYFKRPRGAKADYVHKLASRWREHVGVEAPWNLRLGRTGLFGRRWEQDTHFDLDYHFRHSALPAPGGERRDAATVAGRSWCPAGADRLRAFESFPWPTVCNRVRFEPRRHSGQARTRREFECLTSDIQHALFQVLDIRAARGRSGRRFRPLRAPS